MMAQSLTGTPGHINPMATGVRHLLAAYPPETLGPGDVLITNDPWMTSGQLNDFTVVTPVFREGRIVGYFGNLCHAADIGGQVFSGEAHEIFEEVARPGDEAFDPRRAEPGAAEDHPRQRPSSGRNGRRSLRAGLLQRRRRAGAADDDGRVRLCVDPLADEIIARSERALREAFVPPGWVYRHEVWSDGFEEPIVIVATVTVRGDEIDIDFAGRRRRAERHQRRAELHPGLRLLRLESGDRARCAAQRGPALVHVTAPLGSILNCVDPAAVAARHLIGHFVPGAIFGALAQALPSGCWRAAPTRSGSASGAASTRRTASRS